MKTQIIETERRLEVIGETVNFDQDDAMVIGFLVEHFDQHDSHVTGGNIAGTTGLPHGKVNAILERFARYSMVSRVTRGDFWSIEPQLIGVADQLRSPPPDERDYPKELERWFRSKWWSAPVWIVFVGLPALVGYITMIRLLLAWVSPLFK